MTDTAELIGRVFDKRYQITELIGRGGMGAVYKAVHVAMNQVVALKVLGRSIAGDEKQIQRFYQEARSSSRLKHPNTIKVFDFGKSEDGHLFLAMEYLEGHTLSQIIRQEKVLPVRRALMIGRQVLKSLGEAHKTGLIHRDLKPDNIFITEIYGERDFVKVLDFGIAKSLETGESHQSLTQTGLICGTPLYLSPEQALGRPLDGRSDLYSFGIILYEMISGQPPFRAETPIALVMRHIHDKPPLLNEYNRDLIIPDKLKDLIFSLLEKEKTKRPADAEEVIALIDDILAEGNFPEIPSKNYIPNYPVAHPQTKVERIPSQESSSLPSNEIQTVFLHHESDGMAQPDHEAPTTFMSQEKINKIPAVPFRNKAVEASPETAVKTLAESGTRIVVPYQEKKKGRNIWIFITVFSLLLALSVSSIYLYYRAKANGGKGDAKASVLRQSPKMKFTEMPLLKNSGSQVSKTPAQPGVEQNMKTINVTINSEPQGASVFRGDINLGKTPLLYEFREGEAQSRFLLKLSGYEDKSFEIEPSKLSTSSQRDFTIKMTQLRQAGKKTTQVQTQQVKKGQKKEEKKKKVKKTLDWEDF